MEAKYLTVKQYARHIGRSDRTVREYIYTGVIPSIKIRSSIFIDPAKADRALERFERPEMAIKG